MPLDPLSVLPPLAGASFLRMYLNAAPIVVLAVGLAAYLLAVRRQNRLHPLHRWHLRRTMAYVGGTAVTFVAICSFIGVYDRTLFWVHMIQHLMLIMVAASLFAASSPVALLWHATSGASHRRVSAALRSRPARVVGHPVTAFALYGLIVPLTHLTVFFDYAIEYSAVDELDHLCFVVVGFLFFRQLFGADPNRYRVQPAIRALLVFLAVPVDTFVGLTLNSENKEIFPAFAAEHRTWGPSLVMDLHVGGVIMWVGGDVLMMLALFPVIVTWMRREDRHAAAFDRELESFFPPGLPPGQPTAGFALGSGKPRRPPRVAAEPADPLGSA